MLHLTNVIQLPHLPIIRYPQVIQIHLLNLLGMVGFHVPGPLLDSYMVKVEQELADFYHSVLGVELMTALEFIGLEEIQVRMRF